MILYLFELKYLLSHNINLGRDFFDKIRFSFRHFDYKKLKYQPNIAKIMIYHKIIKKNNIVKNKHIIIKDTICHI